MTSDPWREAGATDGMEAPHDHDVRVVEGVEPDAIDVDMIEVDAHDVEVETADLVDDEVDDESDVVSGGAGEQGADGGDGTDRSLVGQGALPLDVRTGDPRVDAAVAALRDLDDLPVADHAEVFTQVHRDLQDALLTLDQD